LSGHGPTPGHGYAEGQGPTAKRYGPRDWPASEEVIALEEADSHFTPPRPQKILTSADPVRRLASLGAIIGPLLAITALILRAGIGPGPTVTGLLWFAASLFIVSLIVLLAKMPSKTSDSDGFHDDGAVV